MKIPSLSSVECAILHDQFQPIDGQMMFAAINHLARDLGYTDECKLMVMSTEKDIYVMAGEHRILVSQNPEPLAMDGFQTALEAPYTNMAFPNVRDVVERHRANTFITIAKGAMEVPREVFGDELGEAFAPMTTFTTSQEVLRATTFCEALVKLIIQKNPASAIHWCASDNLVSEGFFKSALDDNIQMVLHCRPFLSSSSGRLGEGYPIGFVANGSQWQIGKIVEFDEALVPLPWMMEVLLTFLQVCQTRDSIIPHMESFSVEGQDWSIGVIHEKIEGFDRWEKVRLVVLNAPEFGIHNEDSPNRVFHYEDEGDMRARVAEEERELRAASNQNAANGASADQSGFSANEDQSTRRRSTRFTREAAEQTNASVAMLRKKLQENTVTPEAEETARGLMSYVRKKMLNRK